MMNRLKSRNLADCCNSELCPWANDVYSWQAGVILQVNMIKVKCHLSTWHSSKLIVFASQLKQQSSNADRYSWVVRDNIGGS